ncbi:DUF6119 family protein [Listeria costaricensis]|uniref:DUF6119 family protein n=1 Tax=Listeria costaricensis TaxID=2026604 RepID=UPI000C08AF9A
MNYLLKEGFSDNFLKENHGLKEYKENIFTAYTPERSPKWIKGFFVNEELNLTTKSVAAVFKKTITINNEEKHFIFCFGTGFHKLNPDAFEKRFGLKVALSIS